MRHFLLCVLLLAAGTVHGGELYSRLVFGPDRVLAGRSARDGGFLAAMEVNSDELYLGDTLLLRVDSAGAVRWKKILANTLKDHVYAILQMPDGGWLAAGDTYECPMSRLCYGHPVVIRLNDSGQILWQKTFNTVEQGAYCCSSAASISGGGVVLGGRVQTSGGQDILLIALDSAGNLIWSRAYGMSGYDHLQRLISSCDGGLLAFGNTDSGASSQDLFVMKVSASGDPVWTRRFHTGNYQYMLDAAASGCSSYFVADAGNAIAVRLNPDGKPVWRRSLRAGGEKLTAISIEAAGGLVIAGTDSQFRQGIVMKVNVDGTLAWTRRYSEGLTGSVDLVQRESSGGIVVAGSVYGLEKDAVHESRMDPDGNEGSCPLFARIPGVARPVPMQPSAMRFETRSFPVASSDLHMRYRNRALDTALCR